MLFQRDSTRASKLTASSDDSGAGTTTSYPSDDDYLTVGELNTETYPCHMSTPRWSRHATRKTKWSCKDIKKCKQLVSKNQNLEFMVDVYRKTIERVLDVKDVIDYLKDVLGEASNSQNNEKVTNCSNMLHQHVNTKFEALFLNCFNMP